VRHRFAATIILLASAASFPVAAAAPPWRWFSDCGAERTLAIRVLLDGSTLFYRVIPICRTNLQDRRTLGFSFRPRHEITWSGYQGSTLRTGEGERLQGALWQAGGDSQRLVLGLDFSTKTTLILSTSFDADPEMDAERTIQAGLVVRTHPVRSRVFPWRSPGAASQ
jgi:hypothetical protein